MIAHEGHTHHVASVAFSPDGKSVASGSFDYTIRIWDAHRPSPIGESLTGYNRWINSVSYSPLGDIIASGSDDKTIRLWDVNARRQLGAMKGNHSFLSVAFSPDAKLIASGCSGNLFLDPPSDSVQLWDVQNMTAAANPFKGHTGAVHSVQFSPDGTRVVSGSWDRTIRVWDVEHGTTVVGPLKGHTSFVRSVAFSPDGSQIISGSFDRTVRLWDTRSGRTIDNPYEGHSGWVNSVAFSPRGTYVASGGEDKTIRIWDVRTGRQVDQPFEEHTSGVYSVAFSPCGQYIASGSHDKKVIIRNILGEDSDGVHPATSQFITSQMSTQQMFDCLTNSGCIDLSSQMDARQETAMIMSGGGFGDIWMGRLHSGGKVAIKAWRTNTLERCDYKTLKRAARELFLWSRMDHPNIHRLEGVIMFRDQYLGMVSEWMENGNLHEYLRKYPSADRYQLCIHIASGLEYMHARSTVHGDVKAANVLVSSDGVARLSDFDFSVMSEVSSLVFSASSNSRTGSIRWSAPELLEEVHTRTTQSDVYALAMTMLEIFTGDVPYPNCRSDIGVIRTVERGTLPVRPPEYLGNDQKGDMMWQLLLRCWSRDSSERPSSGQVFDAVSR
ncbi:tyrosine kinase family catalytic domain protein, partial [Rhizoctonia solani 123E]